MGDRCVEHGTGDCLGCMKDLAAAKDRLREGIAVVAAPIEALLLAGNSTYGGGAHLFSDELWEDMQDAVSVARSLLADNGSRVTLDEVKRKWGLDENDSSHPEELPES